MATTTNGTEPFNDDVALNEADSNMRRRGTAIANTDDEKDEEYDADGHELGVKTVTTKNVEGGDMQQYRLNRKPVRGNPFFSCINGTNDLRGGEKRPLSILDPHVATTKYLHWTFRTSFASLFLSIVLAFFFLTIFFAILIYLSSLRRSHCIASWANDEKFGGQFADAFALSWTTFSTVGYGLIYPDVSAGYPNQRECVGINILCSFESFVGVLFASFCGAILFGKVVRVQSQAQVVFSDPIVIRYGKGISGEDAEDGNTPCPVLEFRICNRVFNSPRGEIIDASISCIAAIAAKDASTAVLAAVEATKKAKTSDDANDDDDHEGEAVAMEEDTSNLVPRRIFSNMELESSDHPFFKRVWLIRHVLDENSPLLSNRVRRDIRKNQGCWPPELCNAASVRESVRFQQLIVSLSGVCNVNAASVYAQKIYDFADLNVGYQFVNVLYRQGPELKLDISLINNVTEQAGGGGEPFADLV